MRMLLFLLFYLLYSTFIIAQEQKIYIVKAGESPVKVLPNEATYALPLFTYGQLYFRDGSITSEKFNYNYLLNEMQFINLNGDTMAIADPVLIKSIRIDSINFYFDKDYFQGIYEIDSFKLAVKQKLVPFDNKTHSAYGIVSSTSAISTYNSVNYNNRRISLQVDKDIMLQKVSAYFIGNKFNHFFKADKKGFLAIFGTKTREIQSYLKGNEINFNDQKDLKKLLKFCTQINN